MRGKTSISHTDYRRLTMEDNLLLQAYRMGFAAGKAEGYLDGILDRQEIKK